MYRQGDILLIPFPYSDLSATKQRPVLVLSNSSYNMTHHDLVVAAITSNITDREYIIIFTTADLDEGQLRVESGIRSDKIYTFSNRIVIKKFGHLRHEIFAEVKQQLGNLFTE
jgi:mRNA interferase MazF